MAEIKVWECFNLVTVNGNNYDYEALINSKYGTLPISLEEAYRLHSGYPITKCINGNELVIEINPETLGPTE